MVEPIQGLPPNPLIDRLASTFGANAVQSFLGYVEQGVPVGQAYAMAFGNDVRNAGEHDMQGLMQAFADLPDDMRQRIAQGADTLPPPVREALDQLGITPAHGRNAEPAVAAREGVGVPRGEAAPANQAAQAFGGADARTTALPAQAAGTPFAAQEAAMRGGGQQVGPMQQADRALHDMPLPQPGGRTAEGAVAGRLQDPGNAVPMTERMNAALQQMQTQSLPLAPARPEALAAQLAPTLAGATMLANPQSAPLPGQVAAPAPPGTDAAAAQARDLTALAPAGHTVAGSLRRDLRRGGAQPASERAPGAPGALTALLTGRRRPRAEDEEGSTSFQWLFWVLTIVAYGALAVAVVAMVPTGGALTDGDGHPTFGAWALAIGAAAALASWFVGRKLSK